MRDGTLWIIAMQQFNNTNIFKTFLKFHHHALHLSLCQKFLVPFRKIIHESFQNKNTTLINSFSLIDENKFDGGADRLLERTLSTTNRHVTFLPRYPRDSDLYPSASRHEFVSSEAITSAGSAINRGCRRIAAPLSNAIDKKFHGRRPKRAKVDSPRTDIRWRFMFAVPCPVIYLPRGAASQKFSASGTNKNSPSRPWLLLRGIHLRPPPLSPPPFLRNWTGTIFAGENVTVAPLPGGRAIRGDIGGINRVYFRKPCVKHDISSSRVNEPARKTLLLPMDCCGWSDRIL